MHPEEHGPSTATHDAELSVQANLPEPTTPFREAEKRYQQRFEQIVRLRKGRRKGTGVRQLPTDLSNVIDFTDASTWSGRVIDFQDRDGGERFALKGRPGFCLLSSFLTPAEQWRLVRDCFTRFPEPPATTNHTRQWGGLSNLWLAAQRDASLTPPLPPQRAVEPGPPSENPHTADANGAREETAGRGASAQALLEKLRWASIGPNFDWTERRYMYEQPQQPLPSYLAAVGRLCAALAADAVEPTPTAQDLPDGVVYDGERGDGMAERPDPSSSRGCPTDGSSPAWRPMHARDFQPDAALVNYYRAGDTLGGHRDDVEADLSKPIVSISLGCDAIFLLGGETKMCPPHAMLLRSGDVVILAGDSRRCFHGLPRILSDRPSELHRSLHHIPPGSERPEAALLSHMHGRRINISLRETR